MKQKIVIIIFALIVAAIVFLYMPPLDQQEGEPCRSQVRQEILQEFAHDEDAIKM